MLFQVSGDPRWFLVCDDCDADMMDVDQEELIEMAELKGWKVSDKGHYCPACANTVDARGREWD